MRGVGKTVLACVKDGNGVPEVADSILTVKRSPVAAQLK
jgi:hypothetical protein